MKVFFKYPDGSYKAFDEMDKEEQVEVATNFNRNSVKGYLRALGYVVDDNPA